MIKAKKIITVIIAIITSQAAVAQITSPYNLGFEEGYDGSPVFGWALGRNATENKFVAKTTNQSPYEGAFCAKIINTEKNMLENNASFYQRIDASFYVGKRIIFSMYVKIQEVESQLLTRPMSEFEMYATGIQKLPQLFMNARNRRGDVLAGSRSLDIGKKGWNQYTVELEIPRGTTELRFGISFSDTTDIFIDAGSFEIISDDSLHYEAPKPLSFVELMYLLPFANLSGGIQFFHPSKTAAEANWNNVLLTGITQSQKIEKKYNEKKMNSAQINTVIKDSLKTFWTKFAPQIIISNNKIQQKSFNDKNFSTEKYNHLFAWQHTGVPTNVMPARVSGTRLVDLRGSLKAADAVAVQYLNLREAKNKELAISVQAKVQKFHKGATASISFRFENEMGEFISFLKTDSIVSEEWQEYTVQGVVPDDATSGLIILSFRGYGRAFFDDVKAMYRDGDYAQMLTIHNPSFEYKLDFNNSNWMTTNETSANGYQLGYSETEKYIGRQSLMIYTDSLALPVFPEENENFYSEDINSILQNKNIKNLFEDSKNISPVELFTAYPVLVPGEYFEVRIPDSTGEMQTFLDYRTHPISANFQYETGKNENFTLSWKDRNSRLVMMIQIYNLLKNFGLTEINKNDLDSAFVVALKDAAISENKVQFRTAIQNFLDVANDNRARVWFDNDDSYTYSLPFNIELVDNKLFIHQVEKNVNNIFAGDEIVGINGKDLNEYFDGLLPSDAPQWKKVREVLLLKLGAKDSKINLTVKQKKGNIFTQDFIRAGVNKRTPRAIDPYEIINDSILYLDLTYYNDKEINAAFEPLSEYKKFIFDLRGEVSVSEFFLSLLYEDFFQSSITCVPFNTKPAKQLMSCQPVYSFFYPAKTKRFEGEFVFLIDWRTYGNGEAFASVVRDFGIGKLIGGETQGALLIGVPFRLDLDFTISLGTMYGFSPAGMPFLNLPIAPDIKVGKDINNLETDTILQKAIEILSR